MTNIKSSRAQRAPRLALVVGVYAQMIDAADFPSSVGRWAGLEVGHQAVGLSQVRGSERTQLNMKVLSSAESPRQRCRAKVSCGVKGHFII